MAITIDDLDKKVLSLDSVYSQLQLTEPLSDNIIDHESDVKFRLEPDWAMGLDALEPTDVVGAYVTINGTESQMTKEAAVQAATSQGLLAPYIKRVPAPHIERLLNYHYGSGMGDQAFNVLTVRGNVSAFTKPTITPFSNIQLLDNVVEAIKQRHGSDVPIYADYKMSNTLVKTNVRLITPVEQRVIEDGGMPDVPAGSVDQWYAGVHLSNSLVGKTQTSLEAYLFRYWCTNGCTTTLKDVGVWNRRKDGQQDDVYEWARESVDEILGGMEEQFTQVQSLVRLSTEGNTADVLRQIFDEYSVPVSQRTDIGLNLLEQPDLTMYKIMNAITQAANEDDMDDKRRDRLMRIGGAIPTEVFSTLKAELWEEGHRADKRARNPYQIRVVG